MKNLMFNFIPGICKVLLGDLWILKILTVLHLKGYKPREHISHSSYRIECVETQFSWRTQSVLQSQAENTLY
jgi:hypothetical protein